MSLNNVVQYLVQTKAQTETSINSKNVVQHLVEMKAQTETSNTRIERPEKGWPSPKEKDALFVGEKEENRIDSVEMAANSRESRRRKILERGSERLALITGRIPPYPSQIHSEHQTASLEPLISPEADLSDRTTVSPDGENEVGTDVSGSTVLKYDPALDAGRTSAYHNGNSVESLLPESLPETGASNEALEIPASQVKDQSHYSQVSSTDQATSVSILNKDQQMEPQRCRHRLVTLKKIRSAISATERARLFCSIVVALLVVLLDLGFPLPGSTIINSIVSFRPLYLLLLTNLTILLSRLLLDDRGGFRRTTREENDPSTDAYGWAEQASKALEVGLLMQKVIDTVFMNCGIYSIIVICGRSLG